MATGTASTYDLTVGIKLDIEAMIATLTPVDVPLQGTYNARPGEQPRPGRASILPSDAIFAKKVEWLEEEINTPRTTLAATLVTAATEMTVASGTRERFATGDVVRITNEHIRITGYSSGADILTITKAVAGTTAQHSNAADVVGVGTLLAEGSDPATFRFRDRDAKYNLTEIFGPYEIKISGTEETVAQRGGKYGVTSEFDHQVANHLRALAIGVEQAILYGARIDDTTNEWRAMGGFAYYISTNVDSTLTDITYTEILDQWQGSYNNGGMVDMLLVGPTQVRKIAGLDAASIRLSREDRIRGQVVDVIVGPFGEADVVLNRHLRSLDLFGIERNLATVVNLRPYMVEPLAKTGDSMKSQVLAEKSLRFRLEKRHFWFRTLS